MKCGPPVPSARAHVQAITGSFYSNLPAGDQRLCLPVSAFQTSQFASGFGTIAERLIELDYCATLGCTPGSTYIDNNNASAYKAFLVAHNPGLAAGPRAILINGMFPAVKRPDIMCDDGVRKDYYEIKPYSPSGAVAGVGKLAAIMLFMKALGLPYVAGTTYSPAKDIPIMSGTIVGCNVSVSLFVQRLIPGIVTYSICLTGELDKLLSTVAMATLLAWIATELLTTGIAVLVLVPKG